jgi:hypothetical protein
MYFNKQLCIVLSLFVSIVNASTIIGTPDSDTVLLHGIWVETMAATDATMKALDINETVLKEAREKVRVWDEKHQAFLDIRYHAERTENLVRSSKNIKDMREYTALMSDTADYRTNDLESYRASARILKGGEKDTNNTLDTVSNLKKLRKGRKRKLVLNAKRDYSGFNGEKMAATDLARSNNLILESIEDLTLINSSMLRLKNNDNIITKHEKMAGLSEKFYKAKFFGHIDSKMSYERYLKINGFSKKRNNFVELNLDEYRRGSKL